MKILGNSLFLICFTFLAFLETTDVKNRTEQEKLINIIKPSNIYATEVPNEEGENTQKKYFKR